MYKCMHMHTLSAFYCKILVAAPGKRSYPEHSQKKLLAPRKAFPAPVQLTWKQCLLVRAVAFSVISKSQSMSWLSERWDEKFLSHFPSLPTISTSLFHLFWGVYVYLKLLRGREICGFFLNQSGYSFNALEITIVIYIYCSVFWMLGGGKDKWNSSCLLAVLDGCNLKHTTSSWDDHTFIHASTSFC